MALKKTNTLKRIVLELAAIATVVATYHLGDELLFSTETEQKVETEIGKGIYLNWSDRGKERDRKATLVEKLYQDVHGNWDYFDRQWNEVGWIEVDDQEERYFAMTASIFNNIEFNSNPRYDQPREEHFVHELAHVWYDSLTWKEQYQLDQDWLKISHGAYHHCYTDPVQPCPPENKLYSDFVREAATTSCYGADSWEEDLAEINRTVYLLNKYGTVHPEMVSSFLMDVEPSTAPRVLEKIALAAEYKFFSPQERDIASDLLRFQFRNSGAAQP